MIVPCRDRVRSAYFRSQGATIDRMTVNPSAPPHTHAQLWKIPGITGGVYPSERCIPVAPRRFEAYAKKRKKVQNLTEEPETPSTSVKSWETEEVEVVRSGTESVTSTEVLGPLTDVLTEECSSDGECFVVDDEISGIGPLNSTLLPGALPVGALDPPRLLRHSHSTLPEPPDETAIFRQERHSWNPPSPDFESTLVAVPLPEDSDVSSSEYDGEKKSEVGNGDPRSGETERCADKDPRHSDTAKADREAGSQDHTEQICFPPSPPPQDHPTSRGASRHSSSCERRLVEEETSDGGRSTSSVDSNVGNGLRSKATTPQGDGKNSKRSERLARSKKVANCSKDCSRQTTFADGRPTGDGSVARSSFGLRAKGTQTSPVRRQGTKLLSQGRFHEERNQSLHSSVRTKDSESESSKPGPGTSGGSETFSDQGDRRKHRQSLLLSKKRSSRRGKTKTTRPRKKPSKSGRPEKSGDDSAACSAGRTPPMEQWEPEGGFECPEHVPQDILEIMLEEFQKRASESRGRRFKEPL